MRRSSLASIFASFIRFTQSSLSLFVLKNRLKFLTINALKNKVVRSAGFNHINKATYFQRMKHQQALIMVLQMILPIKKKKWSFITDHIGKISCHVSVPSSYCDFSTIAIETLLQTVLPDDEYRINKSLAKIKHTWQ